MNMQFSTENLRNVFAEEGKFDNFKKLRHDLLNGNTMYDFDDAGNRFEISKKDANKAIRKVLMEVCGLNEDTVKNSKLRKRAIKNHCIEIFEVSEEDIEFRVETGLQEDEWFMRYVESRNERLGDDTEFWSKNDIMFVVAEVAGDLHDFTLQNLNEGERMTVKYKNYAVKIGKDIDLILLGRVDYTELVDHVAEAFLYDIKNRCYTAMYGAAAKLPNNSQFNKTGALSPSTKTAFDTLLEDVATANNSDVYIVGTKMALKKLNALADVDWASDEQKRDMNNMGRLGSYEGTTLIEIPQRFKLNDVTADKLYSNNILFVFANKEDKFIKFVDKGDTEIVEAGQNKGDLADDFQTYEVQRSYGVGVVLGQYFGVWTTE